MRFPKPNSVSALQDCQINPESLALSSLPHTHTRTWDSGHAPSLELRAGVVEVIVVVVRFSYRGVQAWWCVFLAAPNLVSGNNCVTVLQSFEKVITNDDIPSDSATHMQPSYFSLVPLFVFWIRFDQYVSSFGRELGPCVGAEHEQTDA